jgi:hypothetical protein
MEPNAVGIGSKGRSECRPRDQRHRRVVNVSMATLDIIERLPSLDLGEGT